ncbi:hypothetical protein AQJ66_00560 [Streptomyces bungoensis]|uniref:Uncharacterized protein n=1 Tax=Streptomyces bungoensis TaxID=285568 RepID=A0A101TDP1_9ACTN|nr:hypothetical protein AQJ66_00560 [Streptomyces bungoensis]
MFVLRVRGAKVILGTDSLSALGTVKGARNGPTEGECLPPDHARTSYATFAQGPDTALTQR